MRRLHVPRALRLILIAFWAVTASTVVLAGSPSIAAPKVPVLGSLSTRVLDRAGAPVDALVIIKGSHSGIGRTDGRGMYKVAVPPGRYEVSAFYAGRTTRPRKVTVAPNRSQRVTIRLNVAAGSPARAGSAHSTQPGAAQPSTAGAGTSPDPTGSSGSAPSAQSQAGSAGAAQSGGGAASPATGGAVASSPPVSLGPLTLQGLTADPTITAPGGTSRIAVQIANPAGDRLTYSWQASAGSLKATGSKAVWTAPETAGDFTISVTVSGIITGQKATGSISVSVQSSGEATPTPTPTPPANGAPQITSTSADPTIVAPGGTSTLVANATDPDGDPLTFSWQASGGTLVPQGSQAVWTAPGTEGQFSITVRADDGNGHVASASIPVSVAAAPSGTRSAALWPFTSTSSWNHPIGSGAIYATETSPLWNPASGGYLNTRWNGVKVFYAKATDPVEKIRTTTPYFPTKEFTWWMPSGFHGALGGDQHAVVISPDGTQAMEAIGAGETPGANRGADGIWRVLSAHTIDLRTSTGWSVTPYDTTAAYASNAGGLIRLNELETRIPHAIAAVVTRAALNRYAPGGKSYVWPAASSDDPTTYATTGNLYMGSLLAIPASVDLSTLGIQHPWAMAIARAMQDYGVYIRDCADRGSSIAIMGEYDLYGKLPADGTQFWQDLNKAIARLQIVTNNTAATIGGGGTPRQPLAPAAAASPSSPLREANGSHMVLPGVVMALSPLRKMRRRRN